MSRSDSGEFSQTGGVRGRSTVRSAGGRAAAAVGRVGRTFDLGDERGSVLVTHTAGRRTSQCEDADDTARRCRAKAQKDIFCFSKIHCT